MTKERILYIHSHCHPSSPTWAFIDYVARTITVECEECEENIVTLTLEDKGAREKRRSLGH